ncbi:MAG: DUF2095 family protein [Candidatus Thorarchaeota archaeon]
MSEDEDFRESFPALTKELEGGGTKEYKIDGVRTMSEEQKSAGEAKTFLPNVIDYIRRCDSVKQANEIIDWMTKQGEIDSPTAREIRKQLKAEGLRSFGAKKEKDHYLRHGTEE